jgi:hypothetical protein
MKALTEILKFYGMPEDNIDMAITQIAQGYGACRYLEGVKSGAEAVKEIIEKKDNGKI